MDKKCLIIGDWIRYKDSHNFKVNQLWAKGAIGEEKDGIYLYEQLEPIPLTEEILKVNGFTKKYDQDVIIYRNKDSIEIEVGISYKKFEDNGFYVRGIIRRLYFVHELQHALRLLGHSELADNFTI